MPFPSRFAGTCAACGGRFAAGTPIAYDRASKTARHAACAAPGRAPAREPGEEPPPAPIADPGADARARTRRGEPAVPLYVTCARCGGTSADGRPMVHEACEGKEDVPF